MICISSITYCIKIDWDFYHLLLTLCDERATSSGGFFVRNSFTLPLREVCVSIKLSFQYKREKRVVFCVHEVERQVKPVSVNETSITLPVFNYEMFFRIVSKRNFERKIRLCITRWIWEKCPSKSWKLSKIG